VRAFSSANPSSTGNKSVEFTDRRGKGYFRSTGGDLDSCVEENMAVSQYLRPGSLLDALTSCFTQGVVKGASSLIGAPESVTRIALHTAAPAVLAAMANMASGTEGANSLFSIIQNGGYHALVDDPAALFTGDGMTASMVSAGRRMTDRLFGEKAGEVTGVVARTSGLSLAPAASVLNLVAPLAMGVVEKEVLYRGLDASSLRSLLLDQKADFEALLRQPGPQVVPSRPAVQQGESSLESNLSKWLAAWLIVLAILSGLLWMRSGTAAGGSGIAAPSGAPATQRTTPQ
jgi:hypothetical protein